MSPEHASVSRALAARAVTLDRLYLAIDAASTRWCAAPPWEVYDRYQDYRDAQRAYADYSAVCTVAPLEHLRESPTEEEEEEP